MRQGRVRFVVVVLTMFAVLVLPSCGFKRKLVSITVIPDTADIVGAGVQVQFKAIGNYVHPPDSRDITDSVAWESAAPQIVTIDQTGLATSTAGCGTKITITATGHSDPHDDSSGIVVGTASVSVTQPNNGCP
ncbi:MAG: Ig-like domain-containing protein [Terriglobales bacterium]